MTVSLTGKIVITLVVLGVVAGMSATIALVVLDGDEIVQDMPTDSQTEEPNDEFLYHVGVGIADMTGPCVEITFMGYAELSQSGAGLHTRQFARSFIFAKGDKRVVLVTAEVQAVGIAVRREVVRNLQILYGDMYSLRNVIITGTHTHSTPGGHLVDFLLDVSILGFSRETYEAYVAGITRSIVRAHENMAPSRLYFSQSKVANAHTNRSPFSYQNNPEEERAKYDSNVDDVLTQIKIVKANGQLHGVMNWFAVHTTSMNMTNLLVSSDNLGYSALKMEAELNPGSLPGKGAVVAGFFSSSLGDVSPNTRGARCEFSGRECDHQFLLCRAQERCFAQGPGQDMYDSARIIGHAVYEGAMEALNNPGEELRGELAVIHQFVDMPNEKVAKYNPLSNNFDVEQPVGGCVPAMGYSFASGTIDGANTLNITQGTLQGNPLLDLVGGVVARPTEEDVACHAPKPILLATGRANFPLPWHPRNISVSLALVGGVAIVGVAGEPTTMAGRRMQRVVGAEMERRGLKPRVVVSGLTNEYIHYVATFEEYQIQRYEAASTIFGPHTLDILLNKYREFINVALDGGDVEPGPTPEDNIYRTISLILPVVADSSGIGRSFGDVLQQPPSVVTRGQTVSASFVGANPRNDLKQEEYHAAVERLEVGRWAVVATDADWNTKFNWIRNSTLTGTSTVRFEWTIPQDASLSSYRIVYHGAARSILGAVRSFHGATQPFTLRDIHN